MFDRKLNDINIFLKTTWNNIQNMNNILKNTLLTTFYRYQINLGSFFVHNLKIPYNSFKYTKCQNLNCITCKFANTNNILDNQKNIPILICSETTCSSKNCIYIIKCTVCNLYYIGQTGREFKTRFYEHCYFIRKLKEYKENFICKNKILNNNKEQIHFYSHFQKHIDYENCISFQIFVADIHTNRLRLENDLILLLNTIYPHGLNTLYNHFLDNFKTYEI